MERTLIVVILGGSMFVGTSCGGDSVIGDGTGGVGGDLGVPGGMGSGAGVGGSVGPCGNGQCAGTGGYGAGIDCDAQVALSKSCARTGCHSALDHYADLDLSNAAAIAAQMVDRPATHGDINCAAVGMPFRECTPSELPAGCPTNALLIDSANFEESWVIKKLHGDESCGDPMPLPPGDSISNGWSDARRTCLEAFFRSLAGTGGGGGSAGTGGAAAAGTAGVPMGGTGGSGLSGYTPLCDLQVALSKSCARTGCHSALDHYGGLDLSSLQGIAAQVVDQPAMHTDINCAAPGMPYRACTSEELAPYCSGSAAVSTLFVDTQNPENSWMLKKLRGEQGECGDAMPLPPGDSATNGWNEARRLCIEDFIYYLAGQR
jgi:hypothetical protein